MPKHYTSLFTACVSLVAVAAATQAASANAKESDGRITAWEASRKANDSDMVTTGVARGRDRLDSATSTSSIKENEISKLAPRSLADLFRNLPGIRVEASAGETNNSYTVRGLPLVGSGAKYLQIQEDGLPVLEFGDLTTMGSDLFIRADLNVGQVESIRGGSASTFASNAPGGVVNLVSKTGEVEGGSVQLTTGLNYGSNRADFDYGGHLGEGWRFHIGGFYRQGEGPRDVGYDAYRGGQVKFNVTKQFSGGYIRFSGKLLDDHTPYYYSQPVGVSGTNANPKYFDLPNFSINRDTLLSRYNATQVGLSPEGSVDTNNLQSGNHVKSKSLGMEAQFEIADWTVTERFRYSDISGTVDAVFPVAVGPAAGLARAFTGGVGGTLTYANGPLAGSVINPATVNGNGLMALSAILHINMNSLRNVTNDLRASRVWEVGGGDLTTTAGVYKGLQDVDTSQQLSTVLQDVVGDGNSARINLTLPNGTAVTQNGVLAYGVPAQAGNLQRIDVRYDVTAPYGSFNFHKGKIAVGGSIRYDYGRVRGSVAQDVSTRAIDMNADGAITGPEARVAFIAPGTQSPVNYDYNYVSYSAGINYRIAPSFSAFARYSRGARAGALSILFSPARNPLTGKLVDKSAGFDPVRQAEAGVKFRHGGVALNLTGFYALTKETNSQVYIDSNGNSVLGLVQRSFRTYGAEFEGSVRRGPFALNTSATVTGGTITAAENPALVGKMPRHQATLIYTLTPQYDVDQFTVGATLLGQTSSYAQDINQLRMPGYATVGLFAQYRPVERLELSVNASNVFDKKAFTEIVDASIPASGVANGRTLYGRLVSASARFFF
ncbi:MAG: TonB-dependent receptor [Sphingobium sp.]